jgi:hypothetical protein
MRLIELIRTFFYCRAAENAERTQSSGPLRSLGVLCASAVRCSSLSICRGLFASPV